MKKFTDQNQRKTLQNNNNWAYCHSFMKVNTMLSPNLNETTVFNDYGKIFRFLVPCQSPYNTLNVPNVK
jgi:hypothetical protein